MVGKINKQDSIPKWQPKPPLWKQVLPNKREAKVLTVLAPVLGIPTLLLIDTLAKYNFQKSKVESEALKQLHQQVKIEAPVIPKDKKDDKIPEIQETPPAFQQAKQNTTTQKTKPQETIEKDLKSKDTIGTTIDKDPLVIEPVKRQLNLYNRIALKNKMLFCVPLHSSSDFIRSFVKDSPKYKRSRESSNRLVYEQVNRLIQRPLFLAVIKKQGRLSAFIVRAQDPKMITRSDPDTYFSKDWLGQVKVKDDKSFTIDKSVALNAQSEQLINAIFADKGAQEYFDLNK